MANYNTLRTAIQNVIRANGNNEITGPVLQQSLLSMISSLGAGYQFMGLAFPSTNPGTPDQNVAYLCMGPGVFSNMSGFVLEDGEIAVAKYNGAWNIERADAIIADLYKIVTSFGITERLYPTWELYGISSGGGINTNANERHTRIYDITPGDVLLFESGIYRVNLYKGDRFITQDRGFVPPASQQERLYESPLDVDFDNVMISLVGSINNNDAFQINNIGNTINDILNTLPTKQDEIRGNMIDIDFSAYVQNGSIDASTGLLSPFANYRSLVGLPLSNSYNIVVLNDVDHLSVKRISYWRSDNTLSRIVNVLDMTNYLLEHTELEVKANVCLISGNDEHPERLNEIRVVNVGSDKSAFISRINGVPVVPESSKDLDEHLAANNPHHITPELIGAIAGVRAAGNLLQPTGGVVDIPAATPTQSGLLTPQNLAKLDNLSPSPINISGSGVTKNASAFGFLPTKSASENVAALRNAVNGGGTILVDYPGTYNVNDTILLSSNTTLIFGAGVFISLQNSRRFLLNEGAINRTYNENIQIIGLHLISNGQNVWAQYVEGLRGYVSFFYIKNLVIRDFQLLDGGSGPFVIQICTFENILIENVRIEGQKDAIHLGRGNKYVIRHGIFKTYDDPIAINSFDYITSNPEIGNIEDGLIEDCYDLEQSSTTGYFARLINAAWGNWESGMLVNSLGDAVVSNGRIYRTAGESGSELTSTVQPNFESGTETLSDGVTWRIMQEGALYSAVVKNCHFKDIFLQKNRNNAFGIYSGSDAYMRSYYPGSAIPVAENIILENITTNATIPNLIRCTSPVSLLRLINSWILNCKILFQNIGVQGMNYNKTQLVLDGTTFAGSGAFIYVESQNRPVDLKILGSAIINTITPSVQGVTLISNDLGL